MKVASMPQSKGVTHAVAQQSSHPCRPPKKLAYMPLTKGIINAVPKTNSHYYHTTKESSLLFSEEALISAGRQMYH